MAGLTDCGTDNQNGAGTSDIAVKGVAGYRPELQPDKATLQSWLQQLHDFGPIRATGTKRS